ncbi:MAG TPA: RES family NAD+ phosphorylase [Candidatus Eisenbacteria bacterium]|nr:RES family NAD+ phosphorylase [Candidatus Eisenbacteria bacterium]
MSPPQDRDALADLESWTNDRIQNDLGERILLPRAELATGRNASIVNAAFCHPHPSGGRFTSGDLGGWYAAFDLDTAHAEVAFHWRGEFEEVGHASGRVEARDYLADFNAAFHDVRDRRRFRSAYGARSYVASQKLGLRLRSAGSNGIVYDSVRHPGHTCVVAFRPRLVLNVRQGSHFEYVWSGKKEPAIRRVTGRAS